MYPRKLCQAFAKLRCHHTISFANWCKNSKEEFGLLFLRKTPEEQVSETEYEPSILEEPSKACTGDQCAAREAAQEAESSVSLDIEEPSELWGPDKIFARLRAIDANLG